MKLNKLLLLVPFFLFAGLLAFTSAKQTPDDKFLTYIFDPKKENLKLYWKDDKGGLLNNFTNLKAYVESKQATLLFAMNAGMYQKDHSPQGLFIQDQKVIKTLDTLYGNGNFYLKPNGVFYLTSEGLAKICITENFVTATTVKFATQSGPMLLIDGKIHPAFKKGSTNLNIRNGVGILPGNKVLFALSKNEINFYDFAEFFKKAGCKNALYLDGFVSRAYLPGKNWIQTDGSFGVMIGIIKN